MHRVFCSFLSVLTVGAGSVVGCEIHSTYLGIPEMRGDARVQAFGALQSSTYDAPASGGHTLDSQTIQFGANTRIGAHWTLTGVLPYQDRALDGGEIETSGWGDLSLTASYRIQEESAASRVSLDLYGGVKMPTGDSDALSDEAPSEAHEGPGHRAHHAVEAHTHHPHGHHMALGSGSWDFIGGIRAGARLDRWSADADAQYILRTEGDYAFTYGDQFTVRASLLHAWTVVGSHRIQAGAELTTEWRDDNESAGVAQAGSGKSAAYAGPSLRYRVGDAFTAALAWDWPVTSENEGLHGAADERVRASLAYAF